MSNLLSAVREMQLDTGHYEPQSLFGMLGNSMTISLAEVFVERLRGMGLIAGIAGGYARDLYYGAKPKDIDIVISSANQLTDTEYFQYASAISELLSQLGIPSQIHTAYARHEESPSFCSTGRLSVVLSAKGADFIFYCKAENLIDILSQFDFNLNQFAMVGSVPTYLGHEVHPNTQLVKLRDILPDRIEYIQKKWEHLVCQK